MEQQLIQQISLASGPERESLIRKLDSVPVDKYPVFDRWFLVYSNESPLTSWDDEGFHPERSTWPDELQILWASVYSKSDIDNGGLHQYFSNQTGTYAPEFHDFLVRTGNTAAAKVLKQAMSHFGATYPRSRSQRIDILGNHQNGKRANWDPFYEIDSVFSAAFNNAPDLPRTDCETWMKANCGITSLVQ